MKNPTTKRIVATVLMFLLCILAQLLENTSVYLSETVVCGVLALTTLACGYLYGGILALLLPLSGWLITGSEAISAAPLILPCVMLGNLLYLSVLWFFVQWLGKKVPAAEPLGFRDSRFRLVLILALVAAVLWSCLATAFLSGLSGLLQLESVTPLLLVVLIAIGGSLFLFAGLWVLVCRFPKLWTVITGLVLGAGGKFLLLRLLVVQQILPAAQKLDEIGLALAQRHYGTAQLFAALLGGGLAFLLWLPYEKYKKNRKKQKKGGKL